MASLPGSARLPRLRPLIASLLVLGCRESLEPSESANPPPPPPAPPTFALEVAVLTEGVNPDPDGYMISIDRLPLTTRARDTLRVAGLAAGSHTVAISGLSMNCRIPLGVYDVPTPRDEAWEVERPIEAFDGVVHMEFVIQCFEVGTLELVVLSGSETGQRQFFVTMNHDPRVASVQRGVKTRLKSVSVGEHYVWVRALCGFDLGRPRIAQVTVEAGLITQDTIDVGAQPCTP